VQGRRGCYGCDPMSPEQKRNSDTTGVLLVSCRDRPGLVAALAQLLYGHGANILDADQHTDREAGMFFQRIHFDLAQMQIDPVALEQAIDEVATGFEMTWRLHLCAQPKRVALFVSRYDHCLWDLLLRHRAGELRCEIPLIVSNHPDLEPIARQFDIDYQVIPITEETKTAQEAREIALLEDMQIDLVVLARYMQVLTGDFIDRFPARIINIHHSFLPAFTGSRPYHRAYQRGVKRIGATAHYATTDLDEGPIIEQDVIRCSHSDTVPDLVRKGRDVERSVLAQAVRWHLDDRVLVCGNRTVIFS